MQLNLTTIALTLFVVCAGFVLIRGIIRILLGCVVLGASAWVAWRLWQLSPELVKACVGNHLEWAATVLPIVGFLLTFIILRTIVRFLSSPFRRSPGERPPLTLGRFFGMIVFALIPTCLIGLIVIILIHHVGAVAEIRTAAGPATPPPASDVIHSLKASVEKSIPQAWLKLLDPLADPSRVTLARIITEQSQPHRPPEFDPITGKPIPRAIIVNDPELQNLARDGRFTTLLQSPLLTKALNDPKVQEFLKTFQH